MTVKVNLDVEHLQVLIYQKWCSKWMETSLWLHCQFRHHIFLVLALLCLLLSVTYRLHHLEKLVWTVSYFATIKRRYFLRILDRVFLRYSNPCVVYYCGVNHILIERFHNQFETFVCSQIWLFYHSKITKFFYFFARLYLIGFYWSHLLLALIWPQILLHSATTVL